MKIVFRPINLSVEKKSWRVKNQDLGSEKCLKTYWLPCTRTFSCAFLCLALKKKSNYESKFLKVADQKKFHPSTNHNPQLCDSDLQSWVVIG